VREPIEIAQLAAAGLVPCAAYLAVGLRLLVRLDPSARGAERLALAYVFGTGAASLALLLLRAAGVPVPLVAVGAVAILASPRSMQRSEASPKGAQRAEGERSGRPQDWPSQGPQGWARAADAAALGIGALTFLSALGPETAWDGFEYHLPLVAAWTEGPVRAIPGLIDAEFRAGIDLLYVPAVAAGWPDAAAAVSAGFALALAALVRAEATRRASAPAGALAGLATLLAPLVVESAPSTYVDLGVGAYGFAALRFADRWNRDGDPRWIGASAVCAAFAANAKLSGAVLLPAVFALACLGGRRPPAGALLRGAGLAALVTAPWLVKAAVTAGNPLFPALVGTLGGPADARYLELRRLRAEANFAGSRDLLGFLHWLVSITFGRSAHVSGLLGPLPLALAPLAIGRHARATWALAAVLALLVALQFAAFPALRFGTPVWPWLAVAAAVGGRRVAASGRAARAALGAALLATGVHQLAVAGQHHLPRLLALREPRAYERAVFPDQDALREMVGRAEPVVAIPMGAVAWMPKPVYNLLWERNGELYFMRGTPPARALALLRERGVRSLVLDVAPPHPDDGRTGHPIADAWLEAGHASLAADVAPLPARPPRRWVLLRLELRLESR
jgi:hypothetical protein